MLFVYYFFFSFSSSYFSCFFFFVWSVGVASPSVLSFLAPDLIGCFALSSSCLDDVLSQ